MKIDSREFRQRALDKLRQNGAWGVSVMGFAASIFVSYLVNSAVQTVTGLTTLLATLQDTAKVGGDVISCLGACGLPILGGLFVCVLVSYYLSAAFDYGLSALSIAVMRGGARVGHAFSGFGRGWATLYMMAMAHLYIFLYTLLLIIPGICASFSYALIYLIKADHPTWSAARVLAESKRLMAGNRLALFALWCSFLPWWLLCVVTFGLACFFVVPYYNTARAAFYEELLDRDEAKNETSDDR